MTRTKIMQNQGWGKFFAGRIDRFRRNAVRELLKITAHPGMISFAGGLPDPELFPAKEIAVVASTILEKQRGVALQYGSTEGILEMRQWLRDQYAPLDSSIRVE